MSTFYEQLLYPLQDRVLSLIAHLNTGFYLSGGTAASRVYLFHRYSDDLDLFVNDRTEFSLWADRVLHRLRQESDLRVEMGLRDERFVRALIHHGSVELKLEMINDVPSRVAAPVLHPKLGMVDTAENILANKVTAVIDRRAAKDLADIWGFCSAMKLPLQAAIQGVEGKAAGIFPPDLSRCLLSATEEDWRMVRWIRAPDVEDYLRALHALGEALIVPRS